MIIIIIIVIIIITIVITIMNMIMMEIIIMIIIIITTINDLQGWIDSIHKTLRWSWISEKYSRESGL